MAPTKHAIDYSYDDDEEAASASVYVPLKMRREEQLKKLELGGRSSRGGSPNSGREDATGTNSGAELDPEEVEERERAKKRLERSLLAEAQEVKAKKALDGESGSDILLRKADWLTTQTHSSLSSKRGTRRSRRF